MSVKGRIVGSRLLGDPLLLDELRGRGCSLGSGASNDKHVWGRQGVGVQDDLEAQRGSNTITTIHLHPRDAIE